MTKLPPDSPLLALDRLNSWVRAEDGHDRLRSRFKEVIYWVKTKAILEAGRVGLATYRRVMDRPKCRSCQGSGVWMTWYAQDDEGAMPCRGCKGSGTATLKFIETTIGPLVWHTPQHVWWSFGLESSLAFPCYYPHGTEHYESAGDWTVRQTGRTMEPADIERDLLTLLQAYPQDMTFIIDYHARQMVHPARKTAVGPKAWIREAFASKPVVGTSEVSESVLAMPLQ
jgi:hypothetical protein